MQIIPIRRTTRCFPEDLKNSSPLVKTAAVGSQGPTFQSPKDRLSCLLANGIRDEVLVATRQTTLLPFLMEYMLQVSAIPTVEISKYTTTVDLVPAGLILLVKYENKNWRQ
ncbi:unnamed protein product [Allacma fusca]|uniref:Uncharacterized protein n=1 Tax=Allacma fusca TaxID=39272 RepID=A0A8J2JI52_9HEXA|nr:unnamed protein product [Allacma fusca]